MDEGTLISNEDDHDAAIYPILDNHQVQPLQKRRIDDDDEEQQEVKPKKKKSSKKSGIHEDSYGFFISSILSAILGYLIFGNMSIVKFYGNFFSGFYEENSEVISTRGRMIQIVLMGIMHWIITYWLL